MGPYSSLKSSDYEVQGKDASKPEYFVAIALERLKIPYEFQYKIGFGHRVIGGFVVDFLAYTVPFPTPIWVHGEYWHSAAQSAKDKLQQNMIRHFMNGQIMPAIVVWEDEIPTVEDAVNILRERL